MNIYENRLFPKDEVSSVALEAGFRTGAKGTHTSRTIMFDELEVLLRSTKAEAGRKDYAGAIIEMNCLGKPTAASRRLTNQRLGEVYALDPAVPVFRILRRLWDLDPSGRRLLTVLCALARDPLLAVTALSIQTIAKGAEYSRERMFEALKESVGHRINENIMAKIVRNAASSWTQSGHLAGRTFKKRQPVRATPATIAYGLYLANKSGFRGPELFTSSWVTLQDCSQAESRHLALEAKRLGLIDLRIAGEVIEISFDRLDPPTNRT